MPITKNVHSYKLVKEEIKQSEHVAKLIDEMHTKLKEINAVHIINDLKSLEEMFFDTVEWRFKEGYDKIRIGFFGDYNCGKRSVLGKYMNNNIDEESHYRVKMGWRYDRSHEFVVMIRDDCSCAPDRNLTLWSDCGVFFCDLSIKDTVSLVIRNKQAYSQILSENGVKELVPTMLVGYRGNLKTNPRVYSSAEMSQMAYKHNFNKYIEVDSTETEPYNVEALFECVCRMTVKAIFSRKKREAVHPLQEADLNQQNSGVTKKHSFMKFFRRRSSSRASQSSVCAESESECGSLAEEPICSVNIAKEGVVEYRKGGKFVVGKLVLQRTGVLQFKYEKTVQFEYNVLQCSNKVPGNNVSNGYVVSSPGHEGLASLELVLSGSNSRGSLKPSRLRMSTVIDRDAWMSAISSAREAAILDYRSYDDSTESAVKETASITQLPGNDVCADCGFADPKWVTLSYAVLLCDACVGIHRSLSVSVSRTQSLHLDCVGPDVLHLLRTFGNATSNFILEMQDYVSFGLPLSVKRPTPGDQQFLILKYRQRELLAALPRRGDVVTPQRQLELAIRSGDELGLLTCVARLSGSAYLDDCFLVDKNRPDAGSCTCTPLQLSVRCGNQTAVALLLAHGVKYKEAPFRVDRHFPCPLSTNHRVILETLLDHKIIGQSELEAIMVRCSRSKMGPPSSVPPQRKQFSH